MYRTCSKKASLALTRLHSATVWPFVPFFSHNSFISCALLHFAACIRDWRSAFSSPGEIECFFRLRCFLSSLCVANSLRHTTGCTCAIAIANSTTCDGNLVWCMLQLTRHTLDIASRDLIHFAIFALGFERRHYVSSFPQSIAPGASTHIYYRLHLFESWILHRSVYTRTCSGKGAFHLLKTLVLKAMVSGE